MVQVSAIVSKPTALSLASLLMLLVWSNSSLASSNDTQSMFCPHCYDLNSAMAVAESLAPPGPSGPGCDDLAPDSDDENVKSGERPSFGTCIIPMRRVFSDQSAFRSGIPHSMCGGKVDYQLPFRRL